MSLEYIINYAYSNYFLTVASKKIGSHIALGYKVRKEIVSEM